MPDPADHDRLVATAARTYRVPSDRDIVAAPGTQILLPLVYSLFPPGRCAILSPTYAEHARAAMLAGHSIREPTKLKDLEEADVAVIVNPNNPDGRLWPRAAFLALAGVLAKHDGTLIVDEAFMDALDDIESLVNTDAQNVIILRSFGKFYGLAGIRLGFAIAAPDIARSIQARLGPWAVSGSTLSIGKKALADEAWRRMNQLRIAEAAERLDVTLEKHGLQIVGGTPLYRLIRSPRSSLIFRALIESGILVRRFAYRPDWLRFGLPADEESWQRLDSELAAAKKLT